MSRVRALAAAVVLAGGLAGLARDARAGPVSAEARARAQEAFLDGRLDDLEAAVGAGTTPDDQWPLAVRDGWWRPRAGYRPPAPEPGDASLSARRLRWLADPARAALPAPAAGEVDPYPRLTALIVDRTLRESRGAEGLPGASPYWTLDDENVAYLWAWYGRRAYEGVRLADLTEEDRRETVAAQERFRDVVARNRALAVATVLGFVVVAGGIALSLRRGARKSAGARAD